MNRESVTAAAAGSEQERGELNDWGVNTLRELARDGVILFLGGDASPHLRLLVTEEAERIRAGALTLTGYCRASRAGSRFRLNRRARVAVYATVAGDSRWS